MADIDITVSYDDLKKAGLASEEFMQRWAKMVAKIAADNRRLEATAKRSAAVQIKAKQEVIAQGILRKQKAEEDAAAKQLTILRNTMAAESRFAKQKETELKKQTDALQRQAAEEVRILQLKSRLWQDYYTTLGGIQGTGAPTNARNSALIQMLEEEETQARQTALAIQEEADEVERLTQKYAPATIAARRFQTMQEEIRQATSRGILTATEMEAALERLRVEYEAFGSGVMLAGSRFNDLTQAGMAAGRNINRFGMYAQQAGYQIGDFAVQVQAGTNIGVAFAQQAAQLAGLLPGLTGAIVAFASIGVGILIQQLTRAKRETEETFETLSGISEFSDLFRAAGASFEDSFINSITAVREEFGAFVADFMTFKMDQLRESLQGNIQGMTAETDFSNPTGDAGFLQSWMNSFAAGQDVTGQFGISLQEQADSYNAVIRKVQSILSGANSDLVRTPREMAIAWAEAYNNVESFLVTSGQSKEVVSRILKDILEIAEGQGIGSEIQKQITQEHSATLDLLQRGARARQEYNERIAEAAAYYDEESLALMDQIALQRKINQFGEDSIEVLDEIRMQELARYEAMLRQQNLNQDQINALVAIRAQLLDAEQAQARMEIAAAKTAQALQSVLGKMQQIAGIDISRGINAASAAAGRLLGNLQSVMGALSQIGRVGMSNAALAAENAALASGASPDMARVEGQLVEFDQSIASLPQGARTILGLFQRSALTEQVRLNQENSALIDAWNDANSGTGGGTGSGGGTGGGTLTDHIAELTKEIEQRQRLLGVYGEQQRYLENYIEVENRLGEDRSRYTEQQISDMAMLMTQMESSEERWNSLFGTFSSNIESALMDIVSGSDSVVDAFRSMMRSILLEVYQQQIAKPAAQFLGGMLTNLFAANGAAFVGGRVQAYASGGIVDSPTFFNHSGGRGLMGEAGPEAILPLSRASNGKLGVQVSGTDSGAIVITQNFNFSANGDESVKAIIRQESVKIVEQTKRAVVDAKNRGRRGY